MKNKFEIVIEKLKLEFFGIDEQISQVVKSFETWLSVKDYQSRPMIICLWGLTGTGKTALVNRTIDLLELNKKKFYIKFGSKTSRIDDDFEQNTCEDTIFVLDEFQYFKTKKENGDEIDRNEDNSTNIIWELLDGGVVNLYGQSMGYSYEKLQLTSTLYILKTLDSFGTKLDNGLLYNSEMSNHLKKLHVPLDKIKDIEEERVSDEATNVQDRNYIGDEEDSLEDGLDDDNDSKLSKKEREIKKFSHKEIRLRSAMQINWAVLYDFVKYRDIDYSFTTKIEFYTFLKNMPKIQDVINFLTIIKDAKPKLETRDYTKSLIFVLGNLDECFTMSKDLNSDLDADYFHNKTKNITIVDIRKALLNRFRAEQIARLGSTHIIYPSLDKKAFQMIIEKELVLFEKMAQEKFNTDVNTLIKEVKFSQSVKDLIYKEGVFPVVGARSVFSIVNEIVSDKFPTIITNLLSFDIEKTKSVNISFEYNKKKSIIIISYFDCETKSLLNADSFVYTIKVDKLRSEKNKGKQAHRAVHEAGHAICSIILEHSFPEVVYSVVLDNSSGGFNLLNSEDSYYHRKNTYENRISTLLGGFAAEKYVFGDENISNGSSSDIENATTLLSALFKDDGFKDGYMGKYISKGFTSTMMENSNYSVNDNTNSIDFDIKEILNRRLIVSSKTLETQKELFLKVSEYLSKNPKMTNKKLKEYTKKYAVGIEYEDLLKDKQAFYTELLNKKLETLKP